MFAMGIGNELRGRVAGSVGWALLSPLAGLLTSILMLLAKNIFVWTLSSSLVIGRIAGTADVVVACSSVLVPFVKRNTAWYVAFGGVLQATYWFYNYVRV
jgi:hypothetical protein